MTACVDNKEKKGGAAKAVSATLAGVLAVGMVPAVAFAADEGSEVEAEGNEEIGLLDAQTPDGALSEGHISAYENGAGIDDTYIASSKINGPKPTYVQPAGDGVDPIAIDGGFYAASGVWTEGKIYYGYIKIGATGADQVTQKFTVDGKEITGTWAFDTKTPGEYAVAVFKIVNGQPDVYVTQAEKFTVSAASLKDAVITFGNNTEFKDIVFNGSEYKFDASAGDNRLHVYLNGGDIDADVTATIVDTSKYEPTEAQYAGSYYVRLDGKGIYADQQNVLIPLTIEKYDLSTATFVLEDHDLSTNPPEKGYVANIKYYNGEAWDGTTGLQKYFTVKSVEPAPTGAGTYTATIGTVASTAENAAAIASIENTATATYSVVKDVVASSEFTFEYDGHDASEYASAPIKIDYSADKFTSEPGKASNSFDASKITLEYGTVDFDSSEYDLVVYEPATGKHGGIEMLSETGTYELYAVLNAAALDHAYAGYTEGITVEVTQGKIADADVTFAYNGKVVTAIDGTQAKMTYDGTDQFGDITITVKTSQGTIVAPADYTVTIQKKNVEGNWTDVDGIVGAGEYQVVVTSDKYDIEETGEKEILPVTVNQFKPEAIQVAGVLSIKDAVADPVDPAAGYFLPYTGSEITPVIEYKVTDAAGNAIWTTLPADQYEISRIAYSADLDATASQKEVDAVKEIGKYWITVEEAFASPAAGQNFDFANTKLEVRVSDAQVFYDVTTDAWYYDEVLAAANNGWIKGFNNGDFYMPNESIKRGDVCVILARMAGVTLDIDENGGVSTEYYETPFDDVDGNLYYAEAIAWAANTGVVTGYDNTGDFCPEEPITREAFATMLARYAKNLGIDTTTGAGAADAYADGNAVSWWADSAVDWAVSAGIMGVDTTVLAPTANISRAETAAMVVRL